MKLTIEGKPDEIKSILKNLSATANSQEISEYADKTIDEITNKMHKNLFINKELL
ncbi:hypothetical protein [Apilactobacillus quenuiae]|uniref:hypothetical protein n=1 Tax=Apilactobacillus quenuiae TaxID=2008377 RepID=UPI0013000027|nr:hypothetical protein [Apilactobacillus quenuiae]